MLQLSLTLISWLFLFISIYSSSSCPTFGKYPHIDEHAFQVCAIGIYTSSFWLLFNSGRTVFEAVDKNFSRLSFLCTPLLHIQRATFNVIYSLLALRMRGRSKQIPILPELLTLLSISLGIQCCPLY